MSSELIINARSPEVNIALLENKELVELNGEKTSSKYAVGDIYLAKVKKVVSGLNAVFVDLGYEKDAFLHYHDLGPQFSSLSKLLNLYLSAKGPTKGFEKFARIPDIDKNGNIADVIKSGQYIMVQVAKEPISNKGPRLCSEISIAGRNIVLIPFSDKVSISQKIESYEERSRLKKLIHSIKPNNYGVIVRTAAEGNTVAELDQELSGLVEKWENGLKKIKGYRGESAKLILSEMSRVSALLRDIFNPSFSNIIVDTQEMFEEVKTYVRTFAPEKEKIVRHYTSSLPIFEAYGIEKQIRNLFGQNVSIKNGAYLIIQHTEALHVIDVNSGNRTKFEKDQESNAFDVNAIAAREIARQLRVRDMGGIIVVDFIDMRDPENKAKLFEIMKDAMSTDRAKHNILPLSKFGLMQITRQRVRPELNVKTNEICPSCNGSGEITPSVNLIDRIEDDLKHVVNVLKNKNPTLVCHPIIEGYINKGLFSVRLKWSLKYKARFKVIGLGSYSYLEYAFKDKKNKEIKL